MSAAQMTADSFHDWRSSAPCANEDPDLFFDWAENNRFVAQTAKNICLGCPIRSACLDAAMTANEEYGIWGGMDPDERAAYRRQWARKKAGIPAKRDRSEAMLNSEAIDRHYTQRLKVAQECRAKLLATPHFHRRNELLTVLELMIAHPREDGGTLARRAGYSRTWFHNQKREIFRMCGITETCTTDGAA